MTSTTVPQEAVKAAREVLYYADPHDVIIALTAALPYLPQGVGVKKLEWEEPRLTEDGRTAQDATTSFGRYIASDTGWFLLGITGYNNEKCLEAAKEAAQADCDERFWNMAQILSGTDGARERDLIAERVLSDRLASALKYVDDYCLSYPSLNILSAVTQSALEAHEEARILSALEPSAARELALEEAAKIAFDISENGEYHGEASVDSPSSIYQQGAFEVYEALRALSSPDHADAGKVGGDGWKPIESAPKDGTEIIYLTKYGSIGFCRYAVDDINDWFGWWDLQADDEVYPKRWLPRSALPSAPSQEVAG